MRAHNVRAWAVGKQTRLSEQGDVEICLLPNSLPPSHVDMRGPGYRRNNIRQTFGILLTSGGAVGDETYFPRTFRRSDKTRFSENVELVDPNIAEEKTTMFFSKFQLIRTFMYTCTHHVLLVSNHCNDSGIRVFRTSTPSPYLLVVFRELVFGDLRF